MTTQPKTTKTNAYTLSGISLFRALSSATRESLAQKVSARSYRTSHQIIAHNDRSRDIFFVISGRVRATVFSQSGKEVSFEDLGAGALFGELAAIDGKPRSTHVIALTDSLIGSMTAEAFWAALENHPEVAAATLKRLAGLVRSHCDRIYEFSTLGVKNRIHAELLRLVRQQSIEKNSATIDSAPTHAEIASRVSTHREAVTRELKHLESIGLIEWRPGKHFVFDVNKLERMVKEVRGE